VLRDLRHALDRAEKELTLCPRCGNLTSVDRSPCRICSDPERSSNVLCVVEGAPDIQILEQAGTYPGKYFCLGGKISPMNDETVTRSVLESLFSRIRDDRVKEVLLALNTDVESDATAQMLAETLKPFDVKVTRLAFGLPAGSGLAYSDSETLKRALKGRQVIE